MFIRFDRVRRSRRGLAFTLMEAVVTLVVLSIVMGVAVLAYASTRKSTRDNAGKPLLGAVQAQTRGLVAASGYALPTDTSGDPGTALADKLNAAGLDGATFTTAASTASGSDDSLPSSYQVSVTQNPLSPGLVGYAVRTSGTSGKGCTMVVDQVSGSAPPALADSVSGMVKRDDLSTTTTGWWESSASFNSACKVVLPDAVTDPATTPLAPVCQIAELGSNGTSAVVSWTPQGSPDGFKVYKYAGSQAFTQSVTADATLNWLPTDFSTVEGASAPASPTVAPGVSVSTTGDAWEGSRAWLLSVPANTGAVDVVSSPRSTRDVSALVGNNPVTFSVWAKRTSSAATDVALKPVIVWYNASGTEIGRTAGSTSVLGPMYKRLVATSPSVPAGAKWVSVALTLDPVAAPLYGDVQVAVDGFALEAGATPGVSTPTPVSSATVPGASASTWTDAALTPGQTFTYVVTAYKGSKESTISDVAAAQPLPAVSVPSSAVAGLTATQSGAVPALGQGMVLSWTPSAGALSQLLYRKATGASDDTYVRLGELSGAQATYTDTTVLWGGTYTYKVVPTSGSTPVVVCGRTVGGQVLEGSKAVVSAAVVPNPPSLDADATYTTNADGSVGYKYGVPTDTVRVTYDDTQAQLANLELRAAAAPGPDQVPTDAQYGAPFYAGDPTSPVLDVQAPTTSASNTGAGVPVAASNLVGAGSVVYYQARTAVPGLPPSAWSPTPPPAKQPLATPVPTVAMTSAGVATLSWANIPGATSYAVYADSTAPGYTGATFASSYNQPLATQLAYPAGTPATNPNLTFSNTTPAPLATTINGVNQAGTANITATNVTVNGVSVPGRTTILTMGNPSKQTFRVIAFRHDSGTFSPMGSSPDTVASPTVTTSCSLPASATRPLTATVNLTNKTGTATEYRLKRKEADGTYTAVATLPANATSTTQQILANTTYQVVPYFTWPSTATLVAGNNAATGASAGAATFDATCNAPPLAVDMSTFFAGTDGSGLFNDQYVAINPTADRADAASTYYYAVFDAPAYPNAQGTMKAPQHGTGVFDKNNPGFFVTNNDGTTLPIAASHYQVIQLPAAGTAGVAPATPANPAPANTTGCVGDKIVVGPTGTPCGNQLGSLTAFANRQVFAAAGQYNVWGTYVMVMAVLKAGGGQISYDGAYAAQAAPYVTSPAAPNTTATLTTSTAGGTTWQDPNVSTATVNANWQYSGAVGDWASQKWALTGMERKVTSQTWNGSTLTNTTTPVTTTTWNTATPTGYTPGATVAFGPSRTATPGTTSTFQVRYQTKVPTSPPSPTGAAITSGFNPTLWTPDGKLATPPSQGAPQVKGGQWNNDGAVKAPPAAPRVYMNYASQWTQACTDLYANCNPNDSAVEVQISPQPGQPWADQYALYVRSPGGLDAAAYAASPSALPNTPGKAGYRSWFATVLAGGNANAIVQARNAASISVIGGTTTTVHASSTGGATVMGNLTASGAAGNGYVSVFPCNNPTTTTALYLRADQTTPAFVSTATDANGDFCITPNVTATLTWDQTVDTTVVASHAPVRKVDTRSTGGPLTAGTPRAINVGAANQTIIGSLTAIPGAAAGAWVTLATCGSGTGTTAITAPDDGDTVTVGAVVKSDASGNICATSSVTGMNLIWDQTAETSNLPASGPTRTYDSRSSGGAIPVAGTRLVPTGVINSTVFGALTAGTGSSHLTVYPSTGGVCSTAPTTSNLNLNAADVVTNAVAVRTDANGNFCVRAAAGVPFILFDLQAATQAISVSAPLRTFDSRDVTDYANVWSAQYAGNTVAGAGVSLSPPTDASYSGKTPTFNNTWTRGSGGTMTASTGSADVYAAVSNAILGTGAQWGPYVATTTAAASFRARAPQSGPIGSYMINWLHAYCIDLGGSAAYSTSYWGGAAQVGGQVRRWGGNNPTIANATSYASGVIPASVMRSNAYQLAKWGDTYSSTDRQAQAAEVWYNTSAGSAGDWFFWEPGTSQSQVFNNYSSAIWARAVEGNNYGGPNAIQTVYGTCDAMTSANSSCRTGQAVGSSIDLSVTNLATEWSRGAGRAQTAQSQWTWAVPMSGPIPLPQQTGAANNGKVTFKLYNKETATSSSEVYVNTTSLPTDMLTLTPPGWDEATATGQRMWVAGMGRNGFARAVTAAGVPQRAAI